MAIAAVGKILNIEDLFCSTLIIDTEALITDDIAIVSIGPTVNKIGVSSGITLPGGLSILSSSSLIDVTNLGVLEK